MIDDIKLDEKQVELFIQKFRALGIKDPGTALDVIEIFLASFRQDKDEKAYEIAKTICEILEPERMGELVWITCRMCKGILDAQELEIKADTCFSCRITGGPPEKGSCW